MKNKIISTIKRKGYVQINERDWDDLQELVDQHRVLIVETLGPWKTVTGTDTIDIIPRPKFSEDILLDAFRYMRNGGKVQLGVKSPWWAKFVIAEYPDEQLTFASLWKPKPNDIAFYEIILCDAFIKLTELDRKLLISRFGSGKKVSLRKCGAASGISHESFNKHLQVVIKRLKNIVDRTP